MHLLYSRQGWDRVHTDLYPKHVWCVHVRGKGAGGGAVCHFRGGKGFDQHLKRPVTGMSCTVCAVELCQPQ